YDLGTMPPRHVGSVPEALFTPDGRLVAVRNETGADLLELPTLQKRGTCNHPQDYRPPIFGWEPHAEFAPDREMLGVTDLMCDLITARFVEWLGARLKSPSGSGAPFVVRLWGTEGQGELGGYERCLAAGFSRDGKLLATLYEDGTIRLWELPPRNPIAGIIA